MKNISNWFKLNKLSLNIKTNYIMFGIKNKLISKNNLLIKIYDITTEWVNNATFLAVIINSTLSWKYHITTICKKVSKT